MIPHPPPGLKRTATVAGQYLARFADISDLSAKPTGQQGATACRAAVREDCVEQGLRDGFSPRPTDGEGSSRNALGAPYMQPSPSLGPTVVVGVVVPAVVLRDAAVMMMMMVSIVVGGPSRLEGRDRALERGSLALPLTGRCCSDN